MGGSSIDTYGSIIFAGPNVNATDKYQYVYTGTGIHAGEDLTVESGNITGYAYFGPCHTAGVEVETGTLKISGSSLTAIARYLGYPLSSYPGALAGLQVKTGNLVIKKGRSPLLARNLRSAKTSLHLPTIRVNEATSVDGFRDWDKTTPSGAIGSPYKFVQIGSLGAVPTTTPTASAPTSTSTSTTTPPTTSSVLPPQSGSGSSALFDFLRSIIVRLLQSSLLKAFFGFLLGNQP